MANRAAKNRHQVFVSQPFSRGLVLVVAHVVAHDLHRAFRMSREQFPVASLGALGVNAVDFIEVDLRGSVGIEGGIAVDPFAAADGEQGPFLARFLPVSVHARVARVLWVGWVASTKQTIASLASAWASSGTSV